MKFTKMHGLGNDYVYVDCFAESLGDADVPALARQISDRHRGVGGDGLILIRRSQRADVRMEMYNADGGRAQMCGNGIRCVARYALERELTQANPMVIETDAGQRVAQVSPPNAGACAVTVMMGTPNFHPAALPAHFAGERIDKAEFEVRGRLLRVSCVSLGNPHAVVFVGDFAEIDLERDGPALENHPIFPDRINVHFARVDGPGAITMKSWERGSGATQACGTGACAAAILADTQMPVRVNLPGGRLRVDWVQPTGAAEPPHKGLLKLAAQVGAFGRDVVLMTGPAEFVFEGEWNPF
jgi:diaminopimelate epimerase